MVCLGRVLFVEISAGFPFTSVTVSRVWRRALESAKSTGSNLSISHVQGRSGWPKIDLSKELEWLRSVPATQRSTIRSAAVACGLPPTTLFRRVQDGQLSPATSVSKPLLTDHNKTQRLRFCLGHVDRASRLFDDMFDVVHVDEKLFYVTEVKKRFYLLPDEDTPYRALKSKRHTTKVMFLAAVARPRWDVTTGSHFGGIIAIWPIVEQRPAQRSSRNRPAGTMETHNVAISKSSYRLKLIQQAIPAICARMPLPPAGGRTTIQQDNASPHIEPTDTQFCQATAAAARDIALRFQPPNSPDLNCCDLEIFTAIQARQRLRQTQTIDELVAATEAAFWELPPSTVNAAFLSLQCSMNSCIGDSGGNNYRVAHMSKKKLEREGRLPTSIRCTCANESFMHMMGGS